MCGIPRLLGVSSEKTENCEQTDRKVLSITQGKPIRIQAVKSMSVPDGEVSGSWDALLGIAGVSGGKGHTSQKLGSEVLHWWAEEQTWKDAPHQSTWPWDLKCVTYSYQRDLEGGCRCWLHNSTVLLWKSLRSLFLSLMDVRKPIHVSLPPLLLY